MATQVTATNYNLTNLLVEASGQISQDIYRRTINTSPWLKLIKQNQWPDEMGDTISVLTYERTLPASVNTWDQIAVDSGTSQTSKFAIPSATSVAVAQSMKTFSLSHTAIESQPIIVNDVRMGFRFREQIKAVYDNLVENVTWLWIKRYRDEYRRLAGHKIVAGWNNAGTLVRGTGDFYPEAVVSGSFGGYDTSATVVPEKTSILTQALLNKIYMELIRDGAGNRPMGMENGRPIFTLVCSPECSDALIRLNPSIRQDFRESSQVNELLKPLGVDRSYRGFFHVIDTTCPRYNLIEVLGLAYTDGSAKMQILDVDSVNKVGKISFTNAATAPSIAGTYTPGQGFSGSFGAAGTVTKAVVLAVSYLTSNTADVYISYDTITAGTATTVSSAAPGSTLKSYNPRINYEWPTGTFVQYFAEVPLYIPDWSATKSIGDAQGGSRAKGWVVNPAYYTAQYEESFIVHPEVMESLIPAPLTSAGSGTSFNPVNYRGDFKFLNIQHRTENPDGTWGYYRGVLASGSKPIKPQFGVAIMAKRIPDVGMVVGDPTMALTANVVTESIGAAIATSENIEA